MNLNTFYKSIENSKEHENFFAEISTTLILIDICSKIEYPDKKKQNERYKTWLNEYYLDNIPENLRNKYLDAENIYFLRNSILHQGSSNPNTNEHYQKFGKQFVYDIIPTVFSSTIKQKIFTAKSPQRSSIYPDLFFDIHYFCQSVVDSVKKWEINNANKIEMSKELFFSIAFAGTDKDNSEKITIFREL